MDYVSVETLSGENKYAAGEHGLQVMTAMLQMYYYYFNVYFMIRYQIVVIVVHNFFLIFDLFILFVIMTCRKPGRVWSSSAFLLSFTCT